MWRANTKLVARAKTSKVLRANVGAKIRLPYVNPIQAVPGLVGGVNPPPPPPSILHFLKTTEEINMKLAPLNKRREINLLLLSYLSCDVIKVPSWIFMAAIFSLQIC